VVVVAVLIAGLRPAGAKEPVAPNAPVAPEPSISYTISPEDEGIRLDFTRPMAVDRVRVPANNRFLWGRGAVGRVALARSIHGAGVGTRVGSEPWIDISLGDHDCRYVRVVPVLSESRTDVPRRDWIVEGVTASRRRLERDLVEAAAATRRWQRANNCFCCHRAFPLFHAATTAWDRGFTVPVTVLASLAEDIAGWQGPDGAFRFSRHPEFGEVTATAVGAAVLAWNHRWRAESDDLALLKALLYLMSRQEPDSGLRPDFTFAPFFQGRLFVTWLFLEAAVAALHRSADSGALVPTPQAAAWRSARSWFAAQVTDPGASAGALAFLGLGGHGFPEARRSDLLAGLASHAAGLDPELDVEGWALSARGLVLLGGDPPRLPLRWELDTPPPDSRRFLWRIAARAWLEPEW